MLVASPASLSRPCPDTSTKDRAGIAAGSEPRARSGAPATGRPRRPRRCCCSDLGDSASERASRPACSACSPPRPAGSRRAVLQHLAVPDRHRHERACSGSPSASSPPAGRRATRWPRGPTSGGLRLAGRRHLASAPRRPGRRPLRASAKPGLTTPVRHTRHQTTRIAASLAGPMPLTASRSSTVANGPLLGAMVDDRLRRRRTDARAVRRARRPSARLRSTGPAGWAAPAAPAATAAAGPSHRSPGRRSAPRRRATAARLRAPGSASGRHPPATSMAVCTRAPPGSS